MQLDPSAVDAGVRLEALGTIGSTNQEARARLRQGDRGPLWITAVAQTAGRGRLDRSWFSPPGNLYASLLLPDPSSFDHAPELTFVTALAVRDAILAEAPALAPQLGFKWPNDLLLAGQKCAGILIEGEVSRGEPAGPPQHPVVIVGIGVNCVSHPATASPANASSPMAPIPPETPPIVSYPATDLSAHGVSITPPQLFARLSAAMCRRLSAWDRGGGFSAILGDWLAAARGIGEDITVRNGGSEKHGRFVGIDPSGRLVLQRHDGGIEKISAGDVFPFAISGGRPVPSR